MECPKCKAEIPDDSLFCDECGKELFICPKCGRYGRGKMCTEDGEKLIRKNEYDGLIKNGQKSLKDSLTEETNEAKSDNTSLLTNEQLSIKLKIVNKAIIGRNEGPFQAIFQNFPQISGRHAVIYFENNNWYLEDLGSTNGTVISDQKVIFQTPVFLKKPSIIKLANIEFIFDNYTN